MKSRSTKTYSKQRSRNSSIKAPITSPLGDYEAKENFAPVPQVGSPLLTADEETAETDVTEKEEGKTKKNPRWRSAWFGRLTLVSYVIGISNITMFPDMFIRNGQLAFLIPVVLAYFLIGLPLMFVELIIGQVSALSPNKVFSRVSPLLSAIAGGMSIMAIYRTMFFMPHLAQISYLSILSAKGIFTDLPWQACADDSYRCVSIQNVTDCQHHWKGENKTDLLQLSPICYQTYLSIFDRQYPEPVQTPHIQYVNDTVYRNTYVVESDDTFLPGPYGVVLCLLALWACIASSVFIGPAVIGLLFCFLFTFFPVTFSFFSMGYSLTFEESFDLMGILTQADFSKLLLPQTWSDAVTFVLFSLSLADGGVIKIASHHHFDNNLILNAIFAVGADMIVTFVYLVIYAVGTGWVTSHIYPSDNLLTSILSSPTSGRVYSLTAYPEMVSTQKGGEILCFLHYVAILLFTIPSMIISLEVVVTSITDRLTKSVKKRRTLFLTRLFVTISVCFALGLLSMLMLTPGGQYLVQQMFDNSLNCLFLIAVMEIIAVIYLYGYHNFIQNVEAMLGLESTFVHYFEAVVWKGITPVACVFSIVARGVYLVQKDIIELDYVVPTSMRILGWLMFIAIFLLVFVFIGYKIFKLHRQKRSLQVLFDPTDAWEKGKELEEIKPEIMKRPMESVMVPASAATSTHTTTNTTATTTKPK
uniref:Uncharacterized protein n=1 Tax=Panagrolaimus sp. ES5 TaxID=591445 RepID=A0AC34FDB1_9BILA